MNGLLNRHCIVDGYRIAYGVHGDGPPAVLIHGTPSSSHIWRNIVPTLTAAGRRVYVYDLLGYGSSERPWDPRVDTSVSGQVGILLSLLDHWGLGTGDSAPDIVAHDIGGAIAQRLGILHPQHARSLTLIDTVSLDSWPSERTRRQMQAGLETLTKAPDDVHRSYFREWLISAVVDGPAFEADALETYLDLITGPVGQASFFQHQVRHYDPIHTDELTPRLHELAPFGVRLIWGEGDVWQRPEWGRKLHAAIPGSSLTVVPGCGHFAMEDKPAEIAALILEALKA